MAEAMAGHAAGILQKRELRPWRWLMLALGAGATLGVLPCHGVDQIEHPFIDQKQIKSETCLTCHPTKQDAKFVHTAIRMGCEICHHAVSENQRTIITLVETGGQLCASCHEAKNEPVLHGPYKAGQCLICHDPHIGAFKDQIRADVNTLCLSCHGLGQPNVKVRAETRQVSVLGNQSLSWEEYRQALKLDLDPSGTLGHPIVGHPVTGKDLNCLSCHDPHSSALPNLMPHGIEKEKDLCAQCHKH